MLSSHRSMDASWHWPSSTNSISSGYERQKYWTAPLGNLPSSFSAVSRRRHSYYGYRSANEGRPSSAVDSSVAQELQAVRIKRHFSEDSGFSSCGSSASSVTDDIERPRSSRTLLRTNRMHSYHGASTRSGSQSDTVAAVLAAGVSDSEETDNCDSDAESDSVFLEDEATNSSDQLHIPFTSRLPSLSDSSMTSQIRSFLTKVVSETSHKSKRGTKGEVQLTHFGRNILDLGSNLTTKFPLASTELPAMNLPLFLQNRSQYHRLGKFGTSESFPLASCEKQCGFSFPTPPTEEEAAQK